MTRRRGRVIGTWGAAGCEVLAVSNWLLRRDDIVGCTPFGLIDAWETPHIGRRDAAARVGAGR